MSNDRENSSPFLSKNIHEIIVKLSLVKPILTTQCITEELFLDWLKVDVTLENISESDRIINNSNDWFMKKIKIIWSIINEAHDKFITSSEENKLGLLSFCSWINIVVELEAYIHNFDLLCDNDVILFLLKITSCLERNLGDIYSSSGNIVPFLLKDLLASEYLDEVLGKTQVRFLQILFGCVQGLNLRNVVWHGFMCPGDLHKKIIPIFLTTVGTLGKNISAIKYIKRPLISKECWAMHSKLLPSFYSGKVDKDIFMTAVTNCNYISLHLWSSWEFAFELFQSQRFGDSLVFIMPLLENMLRSVYCCVNNCPERTLTAESSVYYITLDDVLAQNISDRENKFEKTINTKLYQMLLDLFVYQKGPRLRDKLSHHEIELQEIPLPIVEYTFGMITSLILMLLKESSPHSDPSKEYLEMLSIPEKYVSIYHPCSLLLKSMTSATENVSAWTSLKVPSELWINNYDYKSLIELLRNSSDFEFCDINNLIVNLKSSIETTFPETLFRPKSEMELISCLSQIANEIEAISQNIVTNSQLKYEQWEKKEMKSRTRDNYKRMINCLPVLQYGLIVLMFSMVLTVKHIHKFEAQEMKNYLKAFKTNLQYVENVSSMSSIKRNRWVEIEEYTVTMMKSISNSGLLAGIMSLFKVGT